MAKFREMLPSIGRGFAEAYVGKRKAERERQISLDEMIMREQIKQMFREPPRPTAVEQYRGALQEAIGTGRWENLIGAYPEKRPTIQKLRPHYMPAERAPGFREPTGLLGRVRAKFDPRMAVITPKTRKVIDNIKTQADLDEFMKDIEDYRAAGVDVNAIREYFGRR